MAYDHNLMKQAEAAIQYLKDAQAGIYTDVGPESGWRPPPEYNWNVKRRDYDAGKAFRDVPAAEYWDSQLHMPREDRNLEPDPHESYGYVRSRRPSAPVPAPAPAPAPPPAVQPPPAKPSPGLSPLLPKLLTPLTMMPRMLRLGR